MKSYKRNIILYDHFSDPGQVMSHCKFEIIFHVKTDDDDTQDVLLAKEEYYMRMLSTLYPFGLNENVKSLNRKTILCSFIVLIHLFLYTTS